MQNQRKSVSCERLLRLFLSFSFLTSEQFLAILFVFLIFLQIFLKLYLARVFYVQNYIYESATKSKIFKNLISKYLRFESTLTFCGGLIDIIVKFAHSNIRDKNNISRMFE